MKILFLLILAGVLGYFAYQQWSAQPEPPPPAPAATVVQSAPQPKPVDFAVKSRVRKLLNEWKRRSLGTVTSQIGSSTADPASELTEIRKALFREGVHSEDAVREVVVRALRELDVAGKEVNEVADGILDMARQ